MSRVHLVAWTILLGFGGFVIYESLQLNYYGSDFGPGPGFFSFWLGVLVILVSLWEVTRTLPRLHEAVPADFFPDGAGVRRILALIGALVAALLLMGTLGYSITILLFSVFLLRVLATQPWWLTLVLSLGASFGTFFFFRALQVYLPVGFLGI
ncbi:MAG: tripartite tricarboxylate transporter TctB family protein [Candidatus Methylomirabilota bacterium]